MKMLALAALSAALLAGCAPHPDTQMAVSSPAPVSGSARLQVTRIGVIADDLAYQERRGLYVIRDAETGKEFIGVSGIGITEVGSHSSGKTTAQDER